MTVKVDIKGAIDILNNLKNIGAQAEAQIAQDAYLYFKGITPIRSGNARLNTYLANPATIIADYPYAQRLDEGYSKQAPEGMTKPLEAFVQNAVAKAVADIIKKKGK